ncbi:MAG: hypothetical protein ACTSV5_10450 [Promethearchaeota archaeon]
MSEKKTKPITQIYLRSYPKVIFLWPLLLTSFILWILQLLQPSVLQPWFGNIWLIVFFSNLFIMAFDFSSAKFFLLIMAVVVVLLLVGFLVLPNVSIDLGGGDFNLELTANFYLVTTLVLALILGFIVISTRFDYWKIERNEIYHKSGLFSSAERIPTKSLRIKKEIPDVFEFFVLRAGSITLMPGHGDVIMYSSRILRQNPIVHSIEHKQEAGANRLSFESYEHRI